MSMGRARVAWALGLSILIGLGPVGVARAEDPKQEAKTRFTTGQSHYNLNEFTEALQDFKEAYRLYPDPVFLYNLGQCERQLGHHEEAVRFYRSFLRNMPKAANRLEVQRKIEEMEAAQKAKNAAQTTADATAKPAIEPEPSEPSTAAAPSAPTAEPPPAPAAPSPPAPDNQTSATPGLPSPANVPLAGPVMAEPLPSNVPALDLTSAATPSPAPAASDKPFYESWWFWTATGVVMAGAGVGTAVFLSKSAPAAPGSALGTKKAF